MDNIYENLNCMLHDRNINLPHKLDKLDELNVFPDLIIVNISSDKLGIQQVKIIQTYLDNYKKDTNIIIYNDTITTFAKSALDELKNIELFSYLRVVPPAPLAFLCVQSFLLYHKILGRTQELVCPLSRTGGTSGVHSVCPLPASQTWFHLLSERSP